MPRTQQRSIAANFPTAEQFIDAYCDRLIEAIGDEPPAYAVYATLIEIAGTLYRAENLTNPLPPIAATTAIEEGRYRDRLIAHQRKTADAPHTLEVFNAALNKCVLDFLAALPPMAQTTPAQFGDCGQVEAFATFPLVDILAEPSDAVDAVIHPFFTEAVDQIGLFDPLRKTLTANYPHDGTAKANLLPPEKFKGTPQEIASTYLDNTPLEALFYAPIPFAFTDAQRFEHMHIVGGSGHGKTQLLQRLILADLTREQPPALIIVDSQGEMLRKIERLQLFTGTLADKLIIIDPEDVEHAPALNMFDTSNARLAGYSQAHKEQIEAGVIELYNYIFAAIAAEMTSRQSTAFTFVTRLMLSMPNATIHTLRELMEDPAQTFEQSAFAAQIEAFDPTSQAYFRNQFYTRRYSDLRQQIARRLYSVVSVPSFDRMFSSPVNKLDMFDAIQNGKVVLINTSKALLKSDASALFRPLHDRAHHQGRLRARRQQHSQSGLSVCRRGRGIFRRQHRDAAVAGPQIPSGRGGRPPAPRSALHRIAFLGRRQHLDQARRWRVRQGRPRARRRYAQRRRFHYLDAEASPLHRVRLLRPQLHRQRRALANPVRRHGRCADHDQGPARRIDRP
jgi:hypothetical protein